MSGLGVGEDVIIWDSMKGCFDFGGGEWVYMCVKIYKIILGVIWLYVKFKKYFLMWWVVREVFIW